MGPWAALLLVLALGVAVLIWNWADIVRRTHPRRLEMEDETRARCLREGMIAYLRGDLAGAKSLFASCIKVDPRGFRCLV